MSSCDGQVGHNQLATGPRRALMEGKGRCRRMRHHSSADEITIKVPGPFAGVAELGFSARYPEQSLLQPLRDVPLWIEGPPDPMRRLADRLRMLAMVQSA